MHENRRVLLIGLAWALFVAAMMTQGVLSAPLSERILHGGAVGYGWLNAGWAVGAFVSVFYASSFIRRHGANRTVTLTMGMIAASLFLLPISHWLALAVTIYFVMGSSRGMGGISLSSEMMQLVPRHFMGRVQNAFFVRGQRTANMYGAAGGRSCPSRRPDLRILDGGSYVPWGRAGGVAAGSPSGGEEAISN